MDVMAQVNVFLLENCNGSQTGFPSAAAPSLLCLTAESDAIVRKGLIFET
jgi:hypothetical protein